MKATLIFIKKPAKKEIAMGCFNLGVLHIEGQGAKQDFKKAKEFFGKSCDLKEQAGCDRYKMPNKKRH
jgi:TPR repeat protein